MRNCLSSGIPEAVEIASGCVYDIYGSRRGDEGDMEHE